MAQTVYPFSNSPISTVDQWSKMARIWSNTGVIKGELNEFLVYADSTGMQIKTKSGQTYIKGHFFLSDAEKVLAIGTADSTNPRIDRVIIRLDWTAETCELAILQGTPAVSPVAPALTQNTSRWEISLAQIRVNAGVATVAATDVTDERNFVQNTNAIQPGWMALTFQSGWLNYGYGFRTAQYRKNNMGYVELRGMITGGITTLGATIAILPSEYRPLLPEIFTVACYNGSSKSFATLKIDQTGNITVDYVPGNYWLSLSGIRFPID